MTRLITHDGPCCEVTDPPHVHVGEEDGEHFIRVGLLEVRGADLDEVLAEPGAWLEED